jgi:hypothetical protein
MIIFNKRNLEPGAPGGVPGPSSNEEVGLILKKSDGNIKGLMNILRWIGLHCILLGLLSCSTAPEGPAMQHSKKSGGPSESPAQIYVGLKVPPMPKGHETELGYLLGPEDQSKYAIEVVSFGSKKIVWMGRLLSHDEQGRAHWEIIAALPPRALPTGYRFASGNCLKDNKPQPEIVAIFKMDDTKTLIRAHEAWKADTQKGTFESLPLEGIQCVNERLNH